MRDLLRMDKKACALCVSSLWFCSYEVMLNWIQLLIGSAQKSIPYFPSPNYSLNGDVTLLNLCLPLNIVENFELFLWWITLKEWVKGGSIVNAVLREFPWTPFSESSPHKSKKCGICRLSVVKWYWTPFEATDWLLVLYFLAWYINML